MDAPPPLFAPAEPAHAIVVAYLGMRETAMIVAAWPKTKHDCEEEDLLQSMCCDAGDGDQQYLEAALRYVNGLKGNSERKETRAAIYLSAVAHHNLEGQAYMESKHLELFPEGRFDPALNPSSRLFPLWNKLDPAYTRDDCSVSIKDARYMAIGRGRHGFEMNVRGGASRMLVMASVSGSVQVVKKMIDLARDSYPREEIPWRDMLRASCGDSYAGLVVREGSADVVRYLYNEALMNGVKIHFADDGAQGCGASNTSFGYNTLRHTGKTMFSRGGGIAVENAIIARDTKMLADALALCSDISRAGGCSDFSYMRAALSSGFRGCCGDAAECVKLCTEHFKSSRKHQKFVRWLYLIMRRKNIMNVVHAIEELYPEYIADFANKEVRAALSDGESDAGDASSDGESDVGDASSDEESDVGDAPETPRLKKVS